MQSASGVSKPDWQGHHPLPPWAVLVPTPSLTMMWLGWGYRPHTNTVGLPGDHLMKSLWDHIWIPLNILLHVFIILMIRSGGRLKNVYELLNLRALKISMLYKNHIFQCVGKIFCVEFQREPLKFHTKYLTHTLKDVDFIQRWKFKSS